MNIAISLKLFDRQVFREISDANDPILRLCITCLPQIQPLKRFRAIHSIAMQSAIEIRNTIKIATSDERR